MLPVEEVGEGLLMFKAEDLWELAKQWGRENGKEYKNGALQGCPPL